MDNPDNIDPFIRLVVRNKWDYDRINDMSVLDSKPIR